MSQIRTNSIVPSGGIPAGASGGGIIQCVQVTKLDTFSTSSTSFVDVTGLSVSITPRSSSNKIYVIASGSAGMNGSTAGALRLIRGSTSIFEGNSSSGYTNVSSCSFYGGSGDGNNNETYCISFIDSPGTTLSTTYKLQAYSPQSGVLVLNGFGSDASGQTYSQRTVSSLILMEVSG